VRIVEVGARDGLQNEPGIVPTDKKVRFIDALSETGVQEIEVSSFVSAARIPQLADAEQVFARIRRAPGVVYSALVPNERGMRRALAAGVGRVSVFTAASEAFCRQNIGCGIAESLSRFVPVLALAHEHATAVRGYVSTAFGCPFAGEVAADDVCRVVEQLLALGCGEVALGDTVGRATPESVTSMLAAVATVLPRERTALHFHDTRGRAADNVVAAVACGIRAFDASAGGLGGCPYAGPGAPGNISTEALVTALQSCGLAVAVDLAKVHAATRTLSA
jgi:hydroxymethylglutaryl-CoA lyase